jgi:Ca2+-binding EF-hand superfamily protein
LRFGAACRLLPALLSIPEEVKMRSALPFLLLLASTAAFAQPPQPPAEPDQPGAAAHEGRWGGRRSHGGVFLSPMGEPFRSEDPAADNVATWFAGADADHDGALTVAEMQADAARFFATLDTNGDGEIDPTELTRYETEIAPEVQVGMQMGERSGGAGGGGFGGGGRRGGGGRGGGHGGGRGGWGGRGGGQGSQSGGEGGGERRVPNGGFDDGLQGAGRYSFINIPEPVISADADLNRGVSRTEFADAAAKRFLMLDTDHDGRVTRAELPPLPQRHAGKPKKRKGGPVKTEGEPLPL